MFLQISCYPCGAILLRPKAICLKQICRLVSISFKQYDGWEMHFIWQQLLLYIYEGQICVLMECSNFCNKIYMQVQTQCILQPRNKFNGVLWIKGKYLQICEVLSTDVITMWVTWRTWSSTISFFIVFLLKQILTWKRLRIACSYPRSNGYSSVR